MKRLFRSFFMILLTLFSLPALHAKKITFPVHGLLVATKEPVSLDVDWDEKWFFETETTKYHHGIARIAALLSEISYIPAEKNTESNELIQSYRLMGFKDEDIYWNYTLDYTSPTEGNNQAAYSFASKDVQTAKGTKKLVLVVLRGTPLSANEWISNINVSDNTHKDVLVHEGFYRTVETIQKELLYYLIKNKISPDEAVFLLTGHSRGGALANILGAKLDDEGVITGKKLFVYTFASPNVSQEEKTSSPKYNFIWNIVSAEDIVPSVPPNRNKWKWKKFGQTRVLVNYWNTDQKTFLNDYLPRMNGYYEKLLLRGYAPFKNGPFIHIQVARILTTLYKSVDNYYNNFFNLRSMAESIFWKIFPEYDEEEFPDILPDSKESKKIPFILRLIQKNVDSNIEGGFEYAMKAFLDMHACESYLSWMLALEEKEVYSTMGSSQISFDGSYDCAVYDDDGNLLARILDGSIELYSLKVPVAGMPYPDKSVLGFPGNQNLTVVIYKDSLIPTIISYQIEHYDAKGELTGSSKKQNMYPRTRHAIRFTAGSDTLEEDSLVLEKLAKKDTESLRRQFGLMQDKKFRIQPEFSYSTERILSLGFRLGCQDIYGGILADFYTYKTAEATGFTTEIGHQHCLYGRIMFDSALLSHFLWTDDQDQRNKFSFVPAGRFSLVIKPRHRIQAFVTMMFDARIKDFNDAAFTSDLRRKTFSHIKLSENLGLYPSMQFGIRF